MVKGEILDYTDSEFADNLNDRKSISRNSYGRKFYMLELKEIISRSNFNS